MMGRQLWEGNGGLANDGKAKVGFQDLFRRYHGNDGNGGLANDGKAIVGRQWWQWWPS